MPGDGTLVVGAGSIGLRHLRILLDLGLGPVAAVDPDEGARVRASRTGAAGAFAGLEAALEAWSPRAAVVCTPPKLLAEHAIACAAAGCALLLEKPVATDLGSMDAIRRASGHLPVMVGMVYRFDAGLNLVADLMKRGAIGTPLTALLYGGHWLPDWRPAADYRVTYSARRELGGGVLLDSIHTFDQFRWLVGEPVRVAAEVGRAGPLDIDTEDSVSAVLSLPSGMTSLVHVDYLQRARVAHMRIAGDEGVVEWDHGRAVRLHRPGADPEVVDPYADGADMYVDQLRHWAEVLEGSALPPVGLDEAARNLALALALRTSSETRSFVTWDGARWSSAC